MPVAMRALTIMAWTRVRGRPSRLGYDFICYCAVCSLIRQTTKEPE